MHHPAKETPLVRFLLNNFIMNKYSMSKHEMPYRFLLYILSVSSSPKAFTECFWYRLESGPEHSECPYLRDAKMFTKIINRKDNINMNLVLSLSEKKGQIF